LVAGSFSRCFLARRKGPRAGRFFLRQFRRASAGCELAPGSPVATAPRVAGRLAPVGLTHALTRWWDSTEVSEAL
jgi:hypothetical protein